MKNMRSTSIYWLIDTRTNTPFYCGKTIHDPAKRLKQHVNDAPRFPARLISKRIVKCEGCVRIEVVEVVPPEGDWVARECRWIELIRFSFPENVNASSGGQGSPGVVASIETRAKLSASHLGKTPSIEARAKTSAALTGLKRGPMSIEHREKLRVAKLGKKQKPEHIAKRAASNTGKKRSSETRARMSAWQIGKTISVECREKLRAAAFRQHARVSANG